MAEIANPRPNANSPAEAEMPQPPQDPEALLRLLNDWMNGDEQEQKETFEFLRRALDEGRPEGNKMFP